MDPDSDPDDSKFRSCDIHDFLVPNDGHTTNESQSLQYVEFGPAAETLLVQDDEEMTSWIQNYYDEFSWGPYVAPPPQNEILDYEDFSSLMATPPQQAENGVVYDEEFVSLLEFLHASPDVTEGTLQQLIQPPVTGVPQQAEVTLRHQPVRAPPPQAVDAFWLPEPTLDVSDYMPPLEPGFNNNHHYFTAPEVDNSPWAASPFPSSFAPISFELPAEATSVVAAVEEAEASSVVAVVEENKKEGSPSIVKEENQVGEQDNGSQEQDNGSAANRRRMRKNHNEHERRRRDKIRQRITHLRVLVPGCKKMNKPSVLAQTYAYLKSLQDQVNMLTSGCNMRMSMAMGMNMGMVPFPEFMPVSTMQIPANIAAQLPTDVANLSGQYLGVYPPGYLQAENNATMQPSTSNYPGEMENIENLEKSWI